MKYTATGVLSERNTLEQYNILSNYPAINVGFYVGAFKKRG